MTASILVFNFYSVIAIMVVLLALLNDLPIMMIAYDDAPFALRPVHWDMEFKIRPGAAAAARDTEPGLPCRRAEGSR